MGMTATRIRILENQQTGIAIGTKLRDLSKMFLELADDIDEATLAFEEKASGNDEELAKLRQLKGLLKSLS